MDIELIVIGLGNYAVEDSASERAFQWGIGMQDTP